MRRDEQGPPPLVEVRWTESVAELAARFEARYERGDVARNWEGLQHDLLRLAVAIMERLPDDFSLCADRENATDLMILSRIVESLRADGLSFPRQAVRFAGADEMDDDERRNHESVVREINDPHPRGN